MLNMAGLFESLKKHSLVANIIVLNLYYLLANNEINITFRTKTSNHKSKEHSYKKTYM